MEIRMDKGVASFVPETETELRQMMAYYTQTERVKVMVAGHVAAAKERKVTRRYKHHKHAYSRVCKQILPDGEVCGKRVKGLLGLSIHMGVHNGRDWKAERQGAGSTLKVPVSQMTVQPGM